jgi:hypothetical protein
LFANSFAFAVEVAKFGFTISAQLGINHSKETLSLSSLTINLL